MFTKNSNFHDGEFTKNWYKEQDCLKRGAWTVCRFKGGGLGKKDEGGVFEGGVDTPMHSMSLVKATLIYLKSVGSKWVNL